MGYFWKIISETPPDKQIIMNEPRSVQKANSYQSTAISTFSLATEYPAHDANLDVLFIDNPYVELKLKIDAIDKAKHSIKIMSLAQGIDPSGLLLLQAIQRAQGRGVQVEYVYDQWISKMFCKDSKNHAGAALADSNLPCPAGVICLTKADKKRIGMTGNDFFHEKIIQVDPGTADEVTFEGGRNNTKFDLHVADAGYILRPVDPKKPHSGQDMTAYFDRTYSYLKDRSGLHPERPASDKTLKVLEGAPPLENLITTKSQKAEYDCLSEILASRPKPEDSLAPFQFRPSQTQLVSNDAMIQLMEDGKIGKKLKDREVLQNDIHRKAAEVIRGSKRATLISYVLGMTEPLEEATSEMLKKGGTFEVWTNGRTAHRDVFIENPIARIASKAIGITASAVDYTFESAEKLMKLANQSGGKVDLRLRNSDRVAQLEGPESKFAYQHIKAIVGDDTTIEGCDNFTRASHSFNNEFAFIFKDPRLAQFLRDHMAKQTHLYDSADLPEVQRQYASRPWISSCIQALIRTGY